MKKTLITGGTGSFGKTVIQHLLSEGASELRVLSRDEWKQEDMRIRINDSRVKFYIGDIRDRASVDNAMTGVDQVFHAAALKQVPSCEFFPMQAVATNIEGSHNVIESAISFNVKSVVCLGTDKAVGPVNAMGMTKGLMEKVAQAAARRMETDNGPTVISSVRYGNVMCSRGSVIPLFIRLIKAGKPLTLTNPNMTRFMLPLRDSVSLVKFALNNAHQGDIFVKKAPACTVETLAKALIELFQTEVPLEIIGSRHGEKLHEVLMSQEESARSEDMGDYYRVRMDSRGLNYQKFVSEGDSTVSSSEDYTSANTEQLDVRGTKELLLSLPEVEEELKNWGVES